MHLEPRRTTPAATARRPGRRIFSDQVDEWNTHTGVGMGMGWGGNGREEERRGEMVRGEGRIWSSGGAAGAGGAVVVYCLYIWWRGCTQRECGDWMMTGCGLCSPSCQGHACLFWCVFVAMNSKGLLQFFCGEDMTACNWHISDATLRRTFELPSVSRRSRSLWTNSKKMLVTWILLYGINK